MMMYLYPHIICFDFGCSCFGPLGVYYKQGKKFQLSHLYRSKSLNQLFCLPNEVVVGSCWEINEPDMDQINEVVVGSCWEINEPDMDQISKM